MSSTAVADAAPVLRLRGVSCRFGGVHAVAGVDLSVRAGERRAILGPNGAGKTTLFNLISGQVPATSGAVEVFGEDVTYLPPRRRARLGLARTFQTSRLFSLLTVEENLFLAALGVTHGRLRPVVSRRDRAVRRQARDVAEHVGLGHALAVPVASLSHGEQRQLEVGMALAGKPSIMLLDEPAAGLSPAERTSLTQLLIGLDPAVTLLVVEHDMDVALRVAQWVTVMHEGRIVAEGNPDDIRSNQRVHDLYLGRSYAPIGQAVHGRE